MSSEFNEAGVTFNSQPHTRLTEKCVHTCQNTYSFNSQPHTRLTLEPNKYFFVRILSIHSLIRG